MVLQKWKKEGRGGRGEGRGKKSREGRASERKTLVLGRATETGVGRGAVVFG
jgi:hypothetical protein